MTAILTVFLAGIFFGTSALVRLARRRASRPGRRPIIAVIWLTLHGFTFGDQLLPNTVPWHRLVQVIVVPFAVGAAGTAWSRDPVAGRRIARLAGITGSLGLYVYATVAVAVIGGGGPFDQDGGGTLRGTISDRLGNNTVLLAFTILVFPTIGWAGAAVAGRLLRRGLASTGTGPVTPTSTPSRRRDPDGDTERADPGVRVPGGHRALRIAVLCPIVAAILVLAVTGWLSGR